MTAEDLHKLMMIHFSRIGFKMWRNELRLQKINNVWMPVPGIGFPAGTPDLVGYEKGQGGKIGSIAGFAICEDKTINDRLSKKQIRIMTMMLSDGVKVFEAHERTDGKIDFYEWQKLGNGIVKKKSVIEVVKR